MAGCFYDFELFVAEVYLVTVFKYCVEGQRFDKRFGFGERENEFKERVV